MGKDLKGKEIGKGIVQRKDGRYQTRIFIEGYGKPIFLYSRNLKEIKKKKEEVLQKKKLGLKIDSERITLNQWFEQWMSLYMTTRLKKTTISNYMNSYKRCEDYIGLMKLKDIQMTHIQYAVNDLYKKGYKISTIKSSVSVIYSCLEKAVTLRILFFNPCKDITYPDRVNYVAAPSKVKESKIERLTDDEIKRFFDTAKGTRYRELFLLLLHTGLRIGEACALEWKDIDFENEYIDVYKTLNRVPVYYDEHGNKLDEYYYIEQITTPKKAASIRKVPLLSVVADALNSWREKQIADKKKLKKKWGINNSLLKNYPELIFTTQNGNCYLPSQAGRECNRIASIMNAQEKENALSECRPCHLSRVYPHLFRHTFVTLCYESGMDPATIMLIVGHAHMDMLEHYTHPDNSYVNNEFNKYAKTMHKYTFADNDPILQNSKLMSEMMSEQQKSLQNH